MLTDDELAALDDWRFSKRIGSRSEAIRQLLHIALRAESVQPDSNYHFMVAENDAAKRDAKPASEPAPAKKRRKQ